MERVPTAIAGLQKKPIRSKKTEALLPMKKWLFLVSTLCCLPLAADAWTPQAKSAKTDQAARASASPAPKKAAVAAPVLQPGEWRPFVDPENQIFPSLLLASATLKEPLRDSEPSEKHEGKPRPAGKPAADATVTPSPPDLLGDQNGLIGVTIASPANGAHVRVELRENALMQASVLEVDLPEKGREYHLLPRIDYKFDALNRVRQSIPMNLTFAVQANGKNLGQRFFTARVHPINDCPYAYQNPDEASDYVDISWMFAAYVNEDHPAISGLLKEAQDIKAIDGFDAYQSHDPGRVLLQVFAVWEALRQHHIKYSDIGTTTTESESLYSLHVRFIEESLAESHANCVDASVMLASVLRRMGIDTFLALEPGHMFLGIYLDSAGTQSACLETTMLGDDDPTKCSENRALVKASSREARQLKGWKCFNEALDSASKEFKKHRSRFQKANDPEYEIVDITSARREGIAPIGFVQPERSN